VRGLNSTGHINQTNGTRKAKQTFISQPAGVRTRKDQDIDGGNMFGQALRREELRIRGKHL